MNGCKHHVTKLAINHYGKEIDLGMYRTCLHKPIKAAAREIMEHVWPISAVRVLMSVAPECIKILERWKGKSLDIPTLEGDEFDHHQDWRDAIKEEEQRAAAWDYEKKLKAMALSAERSIGTSRLDLVEFSDGYKPVPPPTLEPFSCGSAIPSTSGVYFAWSGERVAYVGQSVDLRSRISTSHQNVLHGDLLSFLEYPPQDLLFAEAYYIGICRPPRNFGAQLDKLLSRQT
jgi:hypothetical protein